MGEEKRYQARTMTRKGEKEYRIMLAEGRFVMYAYETPDGKRVAKWSLALDTGEKFLFIPMKNGKYLVIPETFRQLRVYDKAHDRIVIVSARRDQYES